MKRKFLCLLLALAMVLGLAANVSGSGTKTVSRFAYGKIQTSSGPETAVERSTGSETVSWTLTDGLLTISGQGAMADYAEGEAPWHGEEIYSLIIGDGITYLGGNTFRGLEYLQDVTVGRGVSGMGEAVFNDCPRLRTVLFTGDDHAIPPGSFLNCPNLSTFWFSGDKPRLEAGSLTTGFRHDIFNVNIVYNARNETWTDLSRDVCADPMVYNTYKNRWEEGGKCGDDLTWYIVYNEKEYGYSNYLLILGTGPMYDYEDRGAPWYSYIRTIGGVYMGAGVTTIGQNAFAGLSLGSVVIPGSVREIGAGAFRRFQDSAVVTLHENIRYIGDEAFAESGLHYPSFSGPLPEMGSGVFARCKNFQYFVEIPEGTTHIPDRMFADCSAMIRITIPGSVTSVGKEAFSGCTRMKTVNYNGTTHQWDAMQIDEGNEPLLEAELKGVIATSGTCGENAVWALSEDLTTLTISGTGAVTSHPWFNSAGQVETIIVEDGITALCNDAFYDFEVVTRIQLPETLTEIGSSVFRNNYALTELELPAGLTGLGEYAFTWCTSLQSMVIPEGITEIPSHLFGWCSGLVSVELPENVTSIGSSAFINCSSLSEINIPGGLTALGSDAFAGCKSMAIRFEWPEAIPVVGSALHASGVTEVVLPETVTAIGISAFDGCTNLQKINLPDSITSIGDFAFRTTSSLESIHIPEGITTIPFSCFNSSGITELILPEGLTTIEKYAFQSCSNLQKVVLPETVTSIADQVFSYCSSLSEINWPSGVDTIGWHQFNGSGLVEFTVPATVRTVESYAFHNSTKLEKLVFESKDTQIDGGQVLDGCPLLTVYCWNETNVQAAAEHAMVPYVLFDPPAEQPVYPIYTIIACGDGRIQVPAESAGYQWVYIDFIPGPDSALVDLELYYYSEYELELRVEAVDEDTIRLLMPRCPVEFVAYFQNTLTGFIDIKSTDFYYDPVIWAFSSGITTGISQIEFGPTAECNRAQVVTFLWRAAGSPEPAVTENPFVDVQPGSFYEKAVLWAVEKGITNGSDATHFNPFGICNRAQVVTFLYRAFGSPAVENGENPFADVPAESWYTAPVLWAVEMGITNGLSATEFGPDSPCNRAQVVTFLYRAYTE